MRGGVVPVQAARGQGLIDRIRCLEGIGVVADGGQASLQRVDGDRGAHEGDREHLGVLVPAGKFHTLDADRLLDPVLSLSAITRNAEFGFGDILGNHGER